VCTVDGCERDAVLISGFENDKRGFCAQHGDDTDFEDSDVEVLAPSAGPAMAARGFATRSHSSRSPPAKVAPKPPSPVSGPQLKCSICHETTSHDTFGHVFHGEDGVRTHARPPHLASLTSSHLHSKYTVFTTIAGRSGRACRVAKSPSAPPAMKSPPLCW
jgi:hypothetical protein